MLTFFTGVKNIGGVLSIFSKQILALRRWYRYSQEDFGDLAGVTRQTVAKWEQGKCVPDILTVKKLADALKITVDAIFSFDEETKNVDPGKKTRYIFDTVRVESGGIVRIPKEAREVMDIKVGDEMLLLGDIERGIELLPVDCFWDRLLNN